MTRIFTDGAENPGGPLLEGWSVGSGTWTAASAKKRSGGFSYYVYGNAYRSFTGLSELYYRYAILTNGLSDSYKTVGFRNGATVLIDLGVDTAGLIPYWYIQVGGTKVATGTIKVLAATWYLIEFHIVIDDSSGVIQMKVDGLLDIDYSGDTKPGTATTIDNIQHKQMGGPGAECYFDDIALNDTSGSIDNSWCGDGRVVYYIPNAAGDNTNLTPSSGSNYAAVDETTSDDDTTYVEGNVVDYYDLYNLAASGLDSSAVINRIIPLANARDTVAAGGKIQVGLKTNSTEFWSADKSLLTSYASYYGDSYLTNPSSGSAWTYTDLDALQVGIKVRGT